MTRILFMTGGTGFIGSNLLRKIGSCGYDEIDCLDPGGAPRSDAAPVQEGVTFIKGSIDDPDRYKACLARADTVLHMAAVTGKAKRADYFRVNRDGTRTLIEQCRRGAVKRFLFVSTIAVKFKEVDQYHYAESKSAAEAIVRESGLEYCIIRPTIVIGRESPIWKNLAALAMAPRPAVLGNGEVRVQPIHVDDLVNCLASVLREGLFANGTYEVGGPEVVTMEAFLRTIRKVSGLKDRRFLHVPIGTLIPVLLAAERFAFPLLPFTAGQLATFRRDGIVDRNPLFDRWSQSMLSADGMIRRTLARG